RTLVAEARSLGAKLKDLRAQRQLQDHVPALAGFVEQSHWYADLSRRIADARIRTAQLADERDECLERLGKDWTPARLESIETGSAAERRINAAAARYRSALRRRKTLVGRQKALARIVGKQSALLDDETKGLNGVSLDDAVTEQENRLKSVKE